MTHCHQLGPLKKNALKIHLLSENYAPTQLYATTRAPAAHLLPFAFHSPHNVKLKIAPLPLPRSPFRFICVHFSFELVECEQSGVACFASLSREHASRSVRAHSTHARVTLILEWGYARSAQVRATVY